LVCAPYYADAQTLQKALSSDFPVQVFADLNLLAANVGDEAGAIVLTEEALLGSVQQLGQALDRQPSWSDIPIILLASNRNRAGKDNSLARRRLPASASNIVVLERPLSAGSLASAVASSLRSRARQFDMRDRLAELADERSRLHTLLENIPVGVCFMDLQGRTVVSNPLYERYVPGGTIPSRAGEQAHRWVAVDSNGHQLAPQRFPGARALRGETVGGIDFCHSSPDNGESWMRVSALPLYDAHQQIMGAAAVILDINEEKQAELALRQFNETLEAQVQARTQALAAALSQLESESAERERAQEQLRHSLKMEAVGQLTGGIAHDFNNMLTGVLSALDLIRRRLDKGQLDGIPRYMDAAQSSALRAASLTQRLLAFSRRQSLDSKPLPVNELITTLYDLLDRTVTEQINLTLDLCAGAPWVLADANQLENAILNLVINARDAMPDGGVITVSTQAIKVCELRAELEALQPGEYVRVEVRDTGTGIPPNLIDKVFEPFFTTKPQGQGTGLGLSMVYGFARQSHGRLAIESVAGQGTVVSIYLPVAQPHQAQDNAAQGAIAPGALQQILLVEDDDAVRMLNRDVLVELGYQVTVACDGQQALKILETLPHLDLLVTDVGLPGMNGRQLAEVVQQLRPSLPVLFVTGYAEGAASREDFLGANMQMLTKPYVMQDLADKVGHLLQGAAR